ASCPTTTCWTSGSPSCGSGGRGSGCRRRGRSSSSTGRGGGGGRVALERAGPPGLAAGAALPLLAGPSFLWPRAPRLPATPAGLALALVAGVTLLVALSFPLARLGAPFTGGSIAAFSILLPAVSWLPCRFRTALELGLELEPAAPGDHWSAAAGLL